MVAGLQWWLAADHISGVAGGGAVAAWNDSSGNGYNLAQATGSLQPTWQENIINGKPVVRFATDYLDAGNVFTINDTLTMIVLFSTSATTTRQTIIGQENVSNSFNFEYNSATSTAQGLCGAIIPGVFVSTVQVGFYNANTPMLIAYTRSGAGATHAFYYNGFAMTLSANGANSYSADGNKGLGRRSAGSQSFAGDLAELMLWNVVLTAEQLSKAHLYLARKYGLLNPYRINY